MAKMSYVMGKIVDEKMHEEITKIKNCNKFANEAEERGDIDLKESWTNLRKKLVQRSLKFISNIERYLPDEMRDYYREELTKYEN